MAVITIIVPIYNAEKYISTCLDSIIGQSLKDIQIVCIDDGSTDNSGVIIDTYAKKDKRIIAIHKSNEGLVAARKTGIEVAEGEYIGFVDADDYIDACMYETLLHYAKTFGVDLVTSGYVLEGNYITYMIDNVPEGLYCKEQMNYVRDNAIFNMDIHDVGIRAGVCYKLFKKSILEEVMSKVPDTVTYSEDKLCVINYLLSCNSVYVLHKSFYHYLIHPTSMVHKENKNYLIAINELYKAFIMMYQHPNFTDTMRLQAELYITESLIKGINTRMGFENQNMMRIDPYWVEHIPQNASVVLCGAGEFGRIYKNTLNSRKDIQFVACVDENPSIFLGNEDELGPIYSFDILDKLEFSYIIITIKNPAKAEKIKKQLMTIVSEEKILWFKQEEIYWRYVEANTIQ